MNRVLIWDLPTRLFHWLLSGGFVAAALISLALGEESVLFPYHAIIGLTLVLMVCLRVIWGVVGTRYARFGTFVFAPGAVMEYMKGTLVGGGKRYIGHNPGSSLVIFALLGLVLAMGATGVMLGQGNESVKELHEILAWVTVGVVVVHVLGVVVHTLHHRENITASMIHGKKNADASDAIASARPLVAVVFLCLAGGGRSGWCGTTTRRRRRPRCRSSARCCAWAKGMNRGARRGKASGREVMRAMGNARRLKRAERPGGGGGLGVGLRGRADAIDRSALR